MRWGLRKKNLILWRFTKKFGFFRGLSKKPICRRDCPKREGLDSLQFADFRESLAKTKRVVFLMEGWYPDAHYECSSKAMNGNMSWIYWTEINSLRRKIAYKLFCTQKFFLVKMILKFRNLQISKILNTDTNRI